VDETRARAGRTLRRRAGCPAGLAVSSGPIGEPAKPADDPVDVTQILQATKARDHQIFTGNLVKKHLSFPGRAIVSAIRAQEGDYRDWAQIRDWATGIADALLS
jgi:menaquinone-dependent protoporphyrinogen oxidase